MKNNTVGMIIVSLMIGVFFVILGTVKFINPDPSDGKDLLFGVIYLLSGLTMTGASIYRLVVKK